MEKEITLAIETAIGGGSLSLLEGNTIIDRWAGEKEIARSEQLLKAISEFLEKNRIKPDELELLAVSLGPGSYTGARIGLATAIGIKNGLSIRCYGISILNAFCQLGDSHRDIICAISFGKRDVCWQYYNKSQNRCETGTNLPIINSLINFIGFVNQKPDSTIITNHKLHHQIENSEKLLPVSPHRIINAGKDLADYIGIFVKDSNGSDNLIPIYVENYGKISD